MFALFSMMCAMFVLFAAQNTTMNIVLWIAMAVILVLLIMRRRGRKQKMSKL